MLFRITQFPVSFKECVEVLGKDGADRKAQRVLAQWITSQVNQGGTAEYPRCLRP